MSHNSPGGSLDGKRGHLADAEMSIATPRCLRCYLSVVVHWHHVQTSLIAPPSVSLILLSWRWMTKEGWTMMQSYVQIWPLLRSFVLRMQDTIWCFNCTLFARSKQKYFSCAVEKNLFRLCGLFLSLSCFYVISNTLYIDHFNNNLNDQINFDFRAFLYSTLYSTVSDA